jgi:hypothetical protein
METNDEKKPEFVTADNLSKKFSAPVPMATAPKSEGTINTIQKGMETGTETVDKWNKLADKILIGLNSGKSLIDYGMKVYEKKTGKTEDSKNPNAGKTPSIEIKAGFGIEKLNKLYAQCKKDKIIDDKTTLKEIVDKLNGDMNNTAKFIRGFVQNIMEIEWK